MKTFIKLYASLARKECDSLATHALHSLYARRSLERNIFARMCECLKTEAERMKSCGKVASKFYHFHVIHSQNCCIQPRL